MREYGKFTVKLIDLDADCNPQPLANPDHAPERRRLLCRRYTGCLTRAAGLGWDSFHCLECPVEDSMSPQEQYEELDGLAAFLLAFSEGGRAG